LTKYKSVEEIKKASIEELAKITGRKVAQNLVDKLKTE
jgi:excinuclease UvrABC nuclease subunit